MPGVPARHRSFPLVGHAPRFLRDKLAFLESCAAGAYGVVSLRIGGPTYLLLEPADIEHVLIAGHRRYTKTPRLVSRRGRKLLGDSVLTKVGEQHLERRRAVQPAFGRKTTQKLAEVITPAVNYWLDGLHDQDEIDAAIEFDRLARRMVLNVIFGVGASEIDEIDGDVRIRQAWIDYIFRSVVPIPERVPRLLTLRHSHAVRRIDRAIQRAVRARQADLNGRNDLLSLLLDTRAQDGSPLDEQQILDEARMLSVTGYETAGVALAWTTYLIAGHPAIQAGLQREIDDVLGTRSPEVGDVERLRYAERVLSEALRLYPPTWIFIRMVLEDDLLPSGTRLEAGAKLYLSPWVVQRDHRWFPDPERFDPDRFTLEGAGTRPEFAYFPFGGGARLCLGKRLVLLEGVLALAGILQRFTLERAPGPPVRPSPGIVLAPHPAVPLVLRSR